MVIVSTDSYMKIKRYFENFNGLTIHCEQNLKQIFTELDPLVVSAILSKEWQKHIKYHHHNIMRMAAIILKEYKQLAQDTLDPFILLRLAIRERYAPISLCRILLNIEFADQPKSVINDMLKHPHTISDRVLALNVTNCMYNDNYDGPITDMVRRTIGEDYEIRLKKLASDAGMKFHDEVHLRRYGYDKTPDLKLAVPCIYKGKVINWIESKASFGDIESHHRYINDQLASYGNRFGAGIVIYWLGYLDKIVDCLENGDTIIVTDDFPKKEDLVFLNLPFK